jgi:hypothetical protein
MISTLVPSPPVRLDARALEAREHRSRATQQWAEHPSSNELGNRSSLRRGELAQPLDLLLREWNWNFAHQHRYPSFQRTLPLVFLVYPIVIVLQRIVSGGKPIRFLV